MPVPGWTPLDPADNELCWRRFEARFGFHAGVDPRSWPAIREPAPSVTFDLTPVFLRDPAGYEAGARAVDAAVWRALTAQLPSDEQLLALDWQHPGYRVLPARFDGTASTASPGSTVALPVPAFPDGDYYALLTEDLMAGTFGHPWERSLCVFGAALVDTLGEALRTWLPVLRVDGRPAGAPAAEQR